MRMSITRSLLVGVCLMGSGVLNCEAQALQENTFLSLPAGSQTSVDWWKDSLRTCVESGQYVYVCIEANAIDMMYNNLYVLGNAALSNLMKAPGHLVPVHELPSPCDNAGTYAELLRYALKCILAHNRKGKGKVQVVGLSYDDAPYMGFDSRVWHVARYNQAGLTDSLMTYLVDEESDHQQLARLTVAKLDDHQGSMEKSLGKLDYFVWRQFFVQCQSHKMVNEHRMQCEAFRLFDQTFKGRKLVIGCSDLRKWIFSDR